MLSEWATAVLRIETEKRRLEILRYLAGNPSYEAASSLLRMNCQKIGVPTTSDQAEAAIAWLAELELVTVRAYDLEKIARLTISGREVAEGTKTVPGVLRPDP